MRYEIVGETLPAVICTLEEGETMITEKGAMSWMSPNMKMETSTNGGIGKAFGRMSSRSGLVPEFSVARDLSCRSFPDEVWHFWNLTVMW